MATTVYREDALGRDLQNPGTNAVDFLGRAVTATADPVGRPLRRPLRANTTAYTLNQELQFTAGTKYVVTVAGTTAASDDRSLLPSQRGCAVGDGCSDRWPVSLVAATPNDCCHTYPLIHSDPDTLEAGDP